MLDKLTIVIPSKIHSGPADKIEICLLLWGMCVKGFTNNHCVGVHSTFF